jgi:hypothetical protein
MVTKIAIETSKIPARISDEREDIGYFYKIDSDTHPGRAYELHYDFSARRWRCDCPDVRYNHNSECKHIRAVLRDIRARQQAQVLAQAAEVAAAAESEQEQPQPAQEDEHYAECLSALLGELEPEETPLARAERHIEILRRRIEGLEENLQQVQDRAAEQIGRLIERVSALECRLSEFQVEQGTANEEFEFEIKRALDMAQEERVRISAQSVVIDGPISGKRSAKVSEPRAPKMQIEPVERDGVIIECLVEGYRVRVIKNEFSTYCTCDKEGQCEHMKAVDAWMNERKRTAA